jgi:hypothetical protein
VVPRGGRAPVWSAPGVRTDEPDRWSAWRAAGLAMTTVDVVPAADGVADITVETARFDDTVLDRLSWRTIGAAACRRGVA